jgi:cell division protease FtsH
VAVAGRVAEEIVYGTITTGAESDIQQATAITRQMVGRWGMSDAIGLVAVLPADGQGPLLPGVSQTSEATQRLVDEEVRRLIDTAHHEVNDLLTAHRAQLDNLTTALLEVETLDGIDAYRAAGLPMHISPALEAA